MILKAEHIAKSFGEKKVLKDISFELKKGRVVVLMGTNGSGKTTLFNIITGFLKPDKGNIYLKEENINRLLPHLINRKGITRTFQDMRLVNELTVTENVMLSFAKQNGENWWNVFFPNSKVRTEQEHNLNRVKEILETCFISEVAENKASEISYGQQKLLNLACCIANDANVLLLDEPVAGVNLVYRDRLTHIINDLKEQGKAILIIEHNTDFIEQVADEILFLNNGLIAKFNDYNSLRHDPEVKETYI